MDRAETQEVRLEAQQYPVPVWGPACLLVYSRVSFPEPSASWAEARYSKWNGSTVSRHNCAQTERQPHTKAKKGVKNQRDLVARDG